MSLRSELQDAAHDAGGATQTIGARQGTCAAYADFCQEQNIQTRHAAQIKSAQVTAFIDHLRDAQSDRSLCNSMSHLRSAIDKAGGRTMPTNQQLGIAGASRDGARTAMTPETYAAARDGLAARGSEGERAALGLQRELGLRAGEAIQSAKSLRAWEHQIQHRGEVRVVHGCKGGRARWSGVVNAERALAAVREARQAVRGGHLVQSSTLRGAASRYQRECRAVGAKGMQSPHTARYAYAQDRVAHHMANNGGDRREALSDAAQELGHGDGRGTWVAQIYMR